MLTFLFFFLLILNLILGVILMASASTIIAKQNETAAAIIALRERLANSSGITVAESETILANEQANLDAVNATAPAA